MNPREHRAYDALAAVVARLPREHRAYDAIAWVFVTATVVPDTLAGWLRDLRDPAGAWARRTHLARWEGDE